MRLTHLIVKQSEAGDSALSKLLNVDDVQAKLHTIIDWARANLLTLDVALQLMLLLGALVPAAIFGPRLRRFIQAQIENRAPYGILKRSARAIGELATPIALYLSLSIAVIALGAADMPTNWLSGALSLLTAWIVVRLVTLIIRSDFWSRVAFYVVWPIAALDAFGALDNVIAQLQALAIPLGQNQAGQPINISLFDIIRTLIYFGVLFWLANVLGRLLENRIEKIEELTPSLKALIVKVTNVLLPVLALLVALQIVGFNLATLAVFSGAVGLGVGLGLQRIFANFVAGFTLIADRSIKPNDVIGIGDTFGWVISMQARYVAIRTRDGTEHLIPNDKFMSEGVINWSRTDKVLRLHAPFGVSYKTKDLRAVQDLAIEAAKTVERVLDHPAPVCNVMEFANSSVDFDLRFWIRDPQNGMANVRSAVYLELWDRLHANGIEIPFPQRDLHVKSWDAQGFEIEDMTAPKVVPAREDKGATVA